MECQGQSSVNVGVCHGEVVSSCWDGQWAVAGWASHLWELNGVALELRCATACTTATWAMPEETGNGRWTFL